MKKLIYGTLFLALIGIGFTSCEKENTEENFQFDQLENESHLLSQNNGFTIEWNSDGGDNVWTSESFSDEINWVRTNSTNQNFNANIFIGLESDSLTIISKTSSSLAYSYDGKTYQMGNVAIIGNYFKATVVGPNNVPVNLKISDASGDFVSGYSNLVANDVIDIGQGDEQDLACPWCIIWGAAALINSIVDAACSYAIQQDVKSCTANGKCSIVHSCSATCVAC